MARASMPSMVEKGVVLASLVCLGYVGRHGAPAVLAAAIGASVCIFVACLLVVRRIHVDAKRKPAPAPAEPPKHKVTRRSPGDVLPEGRLVQV